MACSALCVSTTRKDRFASVLPSMHRDTVNHSPDTPADLGSRLGKNLYSPSHWSKEDRGFVRDHLRELFALRPAQDWENELGEAGVPCSIQRANEEYVRENWVRVSKLLYKVMTPEHGPMWQPNRLVYFQVS
ncbi:CoA transferase [Bradyrhizobium sp. USDA 4529]